MPSQRSRCALQFWEATLAYGVACSAHSTAPSRESGKRKMRMCSNSEKRDKIPLVIVFTDIDVTGTTRLHVTLAPFMYDILTPRRLPDSSRAARWQFEVDTKQRGTVP